MLTVKKVTKITKVKKVKLTQTIKTLPTFDLEKEATQDGHTFILGIDEAGCGPWAGPVMVGAVVFARKDWEVLPNILKGVNDSKKLTKARREELFIKIQDCTLSHYVGEASVMEIDTLGLSKALILATVRAIEGLTCPIDYLLIDGIRSPKLPHPTRMVVKGDSRSLSIAAASILAKVTRDRVMQQLGEIYPQYGFEKHAGYGTKLHQEALHAHGITDHHRTSYAPIRKMMEG